MWREIKEVTPIEIQPLKYQNLISGAPVISSNLFETTNSRKKLFAFWSLRGLMTPSLPSSGEKFYTIRTKISATGLKPATIRIRD